MADIDRLLGLTRGYAARLRLGLAWPGAGTDPSRPDLRGAKKARTSEITNGRKLNPALVTEIRRRALTPGISQAAVAREFDVSAIMVGKIIRREAWSHVI